MTGYSKVYRSTHPDVIAHREAWDAEGAANNKAIQALKKWLKSQGHLKKNQGIVTGNSWRLRKPIGIEVLDYRTIPEGWKLVRGRGVDYLSPLKKTAVGKELAQRFDAIAGIEDPRLKLPGFTNAILSQPGMEVVEGAVYLLFGPDTCGTVDDAFWQEIKLSEYYAAKEAAA